MARKPTGRPSGRPKSTTGYTTLMCRVPTDKAKHFASAAKQKGISVSALLREAIDQWLKSYVPHVRIFDQVPDRSGYAKPQKAVFTVLDATQPAIPVSIHDHRPETSTPAAQ